MRILVVDDHPVFLAGIEFLVHSRQPEHQLALAGHPHDALATLEQTPFDLMMLDLHLPEMDGLGVLDAIAERGLQVNSLIMSADVDPGRVQSALDKGALGFVGKSSSPRELLDAIDQVGSGQPYLATEVAATLTQARTSAAQRAREHGITPRQVAVLKLLAAGLSNKEIAARLSLTEFTVKSHVHSLFTALGCRNRTSCVRTAQGLGLISNSG